MSDRAVFVGRLAFCAERQYSGATLNKLFEHLLIGWDPGWLDDAILAELPGVELTQRVREAKPSERRAALRLVEPEDAR